MGRALVHNDADFPKGVGGEFGLYPNTPYRPVLGLVELFGRASTVRNVISGSPNRETDPIRAVIGGACHVW
jgi:hypothetical protein